MQFTGERYVPALKGQIYYEHLHRYAIAARFCAGKRVVDIASGEGYGSALLARTAAHVTGVDLDEASVGHARRSYYASNLRFLIGSCSEIPIADHSVDVVSSFETIEHVDSHERMLDEIKRILVPGGILVISSPNKLVYSDLPNFVNPFHVKELYFAELRDMLQRRFGSVAIYGQRLSASSVVHPLAGAVSETPLWYNGSIDGVGPGMPSLKDPVYFVAVCSDEPVVADLSSAYLDAGDDLLADIWVELNSLRQQIGGHPPEPTAVPALTTTAGDPVTPVAALAPEAHSSELDEERVRHEQEALDARASFDDQVDRMRAALEEKNAALSVALERERELLARIDAQIEQSGVMRRDLDASRAELHRASQIAVALHAELQSERSRSERLLQQSAETRLHEEERQRQTAASIDAERQARAKLEERQASYLHQIEIMRAALDAADSDSRALRDMLSSRSWKLTAPLRRVASVVRR